MVVFQDSVNLLALQFDGHLGVENNLTIFCILSVFNALLYFLKQKLFNLEF